MKTLIKRLKELSACEDALIWLETQETPEQAWQNCQRGDWMLWLIGKADRSSSYSEERKPIVRTALECARLAWPWMPEESRLCVDVYDRWVEGEDISQQELRRAKSTAEAAYATASAAAPAITPYDATAYATTASAASSAEAAASAEAAEAASASAYAAACAADAAYAKRTSMLALCADIVRKHYPNVPEL